MMKILINNKKGLFNFNITKSYEAGMVLKGWEVRSIRECNGSISEANVWVKDDQVVLNNMHVGTYKSLQIEPSDKTRSRKLLLRKSEISKILSLIKKNKLYIIPSKVYRSKNGFIKIEISLGQYGNKADKRQAIREKEWKREKHQY